LQGFDALRRLDGGGLAIRVHGDYQPIGQVLRTDTRLDGARLRG